MALQTQRLVMAGLGSRGDNPPNAIQPPLRDGVHLRWAMTRELGFPWHGFFLFRRIHRRPELTCISRGTASLEPGLWPSTALSVAYGEFSSDRPLVLTDDFIATGAVEFDLRDRGYLRFTLRPPGVASVVEARIGFRKTGESRTLVRATAQFNGASVAQAGVSGAPGQIVVARLEADAITSVEFSGEEAALIDICFATVDRGAATGWEPLERFRYPLALPVRHPDYPASSGVTDVGASRNEALSRVLYGPSAPWTPSFPELHDTLRLLVAGGPGGVSMASKLLPAMPGVPSAPDAPVPHLAGSPALDPADPTVLRDDAYQAWFDSLGPAEHQSVVGLRVRWQWTADQMRQAPDAAEFRIYFQPGRTNVLLGNISAVAAPSATETEVTTNIVTAMVNDALIGASLRVGSLSFPIVGSTGGNPLKVRVSNPGLTVTTGTVSVTNGSTDVTGAGTTWHAGMMGLQFNVAGTPEIYRILGVDSPTALRLSTVYSGAEATARNYTVFDARPPSGGAITIIIPERYGAGSVSATNGSTTIAGEGTQWAAPLVGMVFKVDGGVGPCVSHRACTAEPSCGGNGSRAPQPLPARCGALRCTSCET